MLKQNYKLILHEKQIDIELQYAVKKRLTLTVYPDQRVVARIPYGMPSRSVENYLIKKSTWIQKHLNHFEQHPPEPVKDYKFGESFQFLGKTYFLRLKQGSTEISIENSDLIVQCKDPENKDLVEKVLLKWYREKAIRNITPMYQEWIKKLNYLKLPKTILRFYKMKRRWGSCSSKGIITLNTELIKKDENLINYVIVHEICHLKVPAHNKAFYSLLESIIPDWKERRNLLNTT